MRREIKPVGCHVESLDTTAFLSDPVGWFQNYPSIDDTVWFLAHADDGVIWGRIRNGQLVISSNIFPNISPPLRTETLQQARLFGEQAEIRVWRDRYNLQACRLQDHHDENAEAFDEEHILWGTRVETRQDGFTLVAEGRQGLRHAVPIDLADDNFSVNQQKHPLRLGLRHYLAYDRQGQAYVKLSRLVSLRVQS